MIADNVNSKKGILYVVATPIGNLQDISQRALTVLREVDLILAEDTRHSKILLDQYQINNSLTALHDHNEQNKASFILEKLQQGLKLALISDAGTPLINDPGFHLVKLCHQQQIQVVPIPGACAMISALSVAGIPSDRFCFEGFVPAKAKARLDKLISLQDETRTIIFYESTHRLIDSLLTMQEIFGMQRIMTLAKELTKSWETIQQDTITNILAWLQANESRIKGEFVLIISGHSITKEQTIPSIAIQALTLLIAELPIKKACAIVADLYKLNKKELYTYTITHLKH